MTIQGEYKLYPDTGSVGQVASTGGLLSVKSYRVGTNPIAVGIAVSLNSTGKLVAGATGGKIKGIVTDSVSSDSYETNALAPVALFAEVLVTLASGTAVVGGTVYVTPAGLISAASTNNTELDGASFETAGASNTLVTVRVAS